MFTRINRTIIAVKMLRLVLHVLQGLFVVGIRFKFAGEETKRRLTQNWSKQLVKLLGIRLHIVGTPPSLYATNTLIVSNHISWVDIFILNATCPSRFIAKAEIATWPVMGWLCKEAGTIFIEREKARDATRINTIVSSELASGGCVAFFPEGTTTEGDAILKFSGALFQPAVMAKSTVQPVAILYSDKHGNHTTDTAYVGETSLKQTLITMLTTKGTSATAVFLHPILAEGAERKKLTKLCEESIGEIVNRHSKVYRTLS